MELQPPILIWRSYQRLESKACNEEDELKCPRALITSALLFALTGEPQPRLVRKPVPIFYDSDIEPSFRESKNNQTDQSPPSALCHRIERLVFFKKYKEVIDLFEILGFAVGGSGSTEAISATTYNSL
ncbi:hypothetical protein HPP92_026936 [Vanilla planifolia]|uniref:Uncharacterized protein n=1 Tax=Vanilla planifolia TaxID=51239 RepID=A0A835U5I3_VANPL|nr:hypothetical protein HPP92_026936 [Vanilla planifolia]